MAANAELPTPQRAKNQAVPAQATSVTAGTIPTI